MFWEFPSLVVCNVYKKKLLRPFADLRLRSLALICTLLRVSASDRVCNDRIWELQTFEMNGNLDRSNLRSPERSTMSGQSHSHNCTEAAAKLVLCLWQVPQLGIDLGTGYSCLGLQ